MRKLLVLFYIFISYFSFAQNSDIGKIYHFDISLEITVKGHRFPGQRIKYINSLDDSYMGMDFGSNNILIFDFKNNSNHLFEDRSKEDQLEFQYISSGSSRNKIVFMRNTDVKIKKIAESQYLITKYQQNSGLKVIDVVIDIERSKLNAANSLDLNDIINLNYQHIRRLRKLENGQPFIIRSAHSSYPGGKQSINSEMSGEKSIDLSLSVPKKIIEIQETISTKNP